MAGTKAEAYIEEHYEDIQSNIDELEELINYFGDMCPMDLELYATTHYIDNNKSVYMVIMIRKVSLIKSRR